MPFEENIVEDIQIQQPVTAEGTAEVPPILQMSPLMDHFELQGTDRLDGEVQDNMMEIYGFLAGQEKGMYSVLDELRNIENRIGTPNAGVRRYNHVLKWVRLTKHIKALEQQRTEHERINRQ